VRSIVSCAVPVRQVPRIGCFTRSGTTTSIRCGDPVRYYYVTILCRYHSECNLGERS
jgi:hypothetical protein